MFGNKLSKLIIQFMFNLLLISFSFSSCHLSFPQFSLHLFLLHPHTFMGLLYPSPLPQHHKCTHPIVLNTPTQKNTKPKKFKKHKKKNTNANSDTTLQNTQQPPVPQQKNIHTWPPLVLAPSMCRSLFSKLMKRTLPFQVDILLPSWPLQKVLQESDQLCFVSLSRLY